VVLGFAFSVFAGMMFCSFVVMVFRIEVVTMCYVRMMGRLFMIARRVIFGRLLVMMRGMPAVIGRIAMMLGGFLMIGHAISFPVR
jgi:hypothetical protein